VDVPQDGLPATPVPGVLVAKQGFDEFSMTAGADIVPNKTAKEKYAEEPKEYDEKREDYGALVPVHGGESKVIDARAVAFSTPSITMLL
jgi:hypothetical protein